MKKIFAILLSASALFAAVSCEDFDVIMRSYKVMAEIVDSQTLKADDGSVLKIVENKTDNGYVAFKRALIVCDVLKKNDDGSYTARLLSYSGAYSVTAVKQSTCDPEKVGNDASELVECTCTPEYINAIVRYICKSGSSTEHTVDLVFDDLKSNADTSYFKLHHNGFGETYSNPELDVNDLEISESLVSFDIRSFKPSSRKKVVYTISWDWHKSDPESKFHDLSRETETKTGSTSVMIP